MGRRSVACTYCGKRSVRVDKNGKLTRHTKPVGTESGQNGQRVVCKGTGTDAYGSR